MALSSLEHVSEQDFVDFAGVDLTPLDGACDGEATKLHCAQLGEGTAVSADGSAGDPGQDWVGHQDDATGDGI